MLDPVEIGMKMHGPLMMQIGELKPSKDQLMTIARMMDILIASAQVEAVRHGLSLGEPAQVAMIAEKLKSLGLLK